MGLIVGDNAAVLQSWVAALARLATQAHPGVVVESTQGFPVIARALARHLAVLEGGRGVAEAITAALLRDPERVWSPAEVTRILGGLSEGVQRQLAQSLSDPTVRCLDRQTARFGQCPLSSGPSEHQIRTSWGVLQDTLPGFFENIRRYHDEWRRGAFPRIPAAWSARITRAKNTLTELRRHARLIQEASLQVIGINAVPVRAALDALAALFEEIETTPDDRGIPVPVLTRLSRIEARITAGLRPT